MIDLSSPAPETISEEGIPPVMSLLTKDELQIIPQAKSNKRKRVSSEGVQPEDQRNLTPGTPPHTVVPRSSVSIEDSFPKLFPTSPLNGPEDPPEPKRQRTEIEIDDNPRDSSPGDVPVHGNGTSLFQVQR